MSGADDNDFREICEIVCMQVMWLQSVLMHYTTLNNNNPIRFPSVRSDPLVIGGVDAELEDWASEDIKKLAPFCFTTRTDLTYIELTVRPREI